MDNLFIQSPDFSVSTILAQNDHLKENSLAISLLKLFPNIKITGWADSLSAAERMITNLNPNIIFFDVHLLQEPALTSLQWLGKNELETVILAETNAFAMEAFQCAVSGYLLKPVELTSLNLVVRNALRRIYDREELRKSQKFMQSLFQKACQEEMIGVPTMEGHEFIAIQNILRCEGLQKCTRVVTKDRSDLVSSYNLGEFKRLLEPYGFYSPHKSYLINLHHLKKYHKEGTIQMTDGSAIPVAKRLKKDFLDHVRHI